MNEFWRQMIASIKSMRSPMRPEPAEVAFIEHSIAAHQHQLHQASAKAMLLGVTEEIVNMNWPGEVFLESIDRSDAMIDAFWKGDQPGRRCLRQINWWDMDDSFGPYRYAIGDGVFNMQPYPDSYRTFAEKLHSLMEPGGLGFFRVFSQPDEAYTLDDVLGEHRDGKISNFQQLRFCCAIALQESTREGAALNIPDAVELMANMGIETSELERCADFDSVARPMMEVDSPHSIKLYYPTRQEFEEAISPWFSLLETDYGNHPLAQLCPTFKIAARS